MRTKTVDNIKKATDFVSLLSSCTQPVEPWYFYGKSFGYVVEFKPHDAYDWWSETISDPETRRYVHRDSYFIPTDEDFQVREFQVKIKSFNAKGEGPSSLTQVIYYPRDGEKEMDLPAATLR